MTATGAAPMRVDPALDSFVALVGAAGPVCVAGGRTQWDVGGLPTAATRELAAPSGVVRHLPDEMIVRVRAGTTVADLNQVLADAGQMVPLDPAQPGRATVGGVLAVGRSGLRRLRYGAVRDVVLEVTFVSAAGDLVKAGGPVVKNVTGYDLCRLMVGSLGTLGLIAEVVLRCYPLSVASGWFEGAADPFEVLHRLPRPSSVLWDGRRAWVLVEGHPDDVSAQAALLGPSFTEVAGPPDAPGDGRLSLAPGVLRRLVSSEVGSRWLAEVGVGAVHTADAAGLAATLGQRWPTVLAPRVGELHRELKHRFDPAGRLNPGRSVGE